MNYSFLHAKNIKKNFPLAHTNLDLFKEINFSFQQKINYTIAGYSGSGKSTLLHLLSGIDLPTNGKIFFDEIDIHNLSSKQKSFFLNETIGIVFQEPYLIKELNVIENVMLKEFIRGKSYQACEDDAINLLKKVGLQQKAYQSPTTLSVGQQQRIAILRAIFNKPKFLLADEPTANLDQKTSSIIIDLLFECQNDFNIGLIIATHDNDLLSSSQMKLQLKDGSLLHCQ